MLLFAQVMHRGDDYEAMKESFTKQMWSQVCKFYPQLEDKVSYSLLLEALGYECRHFFMTIN